MEVIQDILLQILDDWKQFGFNVVESWKQKILFVIGGGFVMTIYQQKCIWTKMTHSTGFSYIEVKNLWKGFTFYSTLHSMTMKHMWQLHC